MYLVRLYSLLKLVRVYNLLRVGLVKLYNLLKVGLSGSGNRMFVMMRRNMICLRYWGLRKSGTKIKDGKRQEGDVS